MTSRPAGEPRLRGIGRAMRRTAVLLLVLLGASLLAAPSASAHPLGNFTVNSYSGLRVEPRAVVLDLVVDTAEIPTLQAFPQAGKAGVDAATASAYSRRECATLSEGVRLTLDERPLPLEVTSDLLEFPPGSAGLPTARLSCALRTAGEVDTVGHRLAYRDEATVDRVGWREITATGNGVDLAESTVPVESVSRRLTAYPEDLLSSPLDQRRAELAVVQGSGVVTDAPAPTAGPADSLTRGVDRLTVAYTNLVSRAQLTLAFGLLAVILALGLGSLHAFAPGHGKTLMAASLVGREGSLRQAAILALSVTVTHTLGVLALGVLIAVTTSIAPERLYPWLGLLSGLLLIGIGASLLRNGLRARGHSHGTGHSHSHGTGHSHSHGPAHSHGFAPEQPALASAAIGSGPDGVPPSRHSSPTVGEPHGSSHDHTHGSSHDHAHGSSHDHAHGSSHDHAHDHAPVHRPPSRTRSLLAVGFAGGLVPSPSALLVLLGGIHLGRAWFGVLLVLAYGIGMALALVGAGLLLVKSRDRLQLWSAARSADGRGGALLAASRWLPAATALVVIVVGVGVTLRGAAGI